MVWICGIRLKGEVFPFKPTVVKCPATRGYRILGKVVLATLKFWAGKQTIITGGRSYTSDNGDIAIQ